MRSWHLPSIHTYLRIPKGLDGFSDEHTADMKLCTKISIQAHNLVVKSGLNMLINQGTNLINGFQHF